MVSRPGPGRPVTTEKRDQGRVYGKLRTVPQSETVCDNFLTPSIQVVEFCQVHVSDVEVGGNSSSGLSAYLGRSDLQRVAPSPQYPCHGARCTMMAKFVKLAATSAGTHGQKEGQVQASAQEDTERLSINPGSLGCGECGQKCRSHRSVLGTQHCSGTVTEARPHLLP